MRIKKFLLAPFAILYGCIIKLRNLLYDFKILKSIQYDIPTICIGNLSVGGTGKTPHTEYLIQLLSTKYNVATLSRGYKRKSKGYVLAYSETTVEQIGDEPFQFFTKFPSISVAVCEDRTLGVLNLLTDKPNTDVVLLDDAFQHRAIKAGLNILLCDFNHPYFKDQLLPLGSLRDEVKSKERADIILVTKCPETITKNEANQFKSMLKASKNQNVYFTTIHYGKLLLGNHFEETIMGKAYAITGIANNKAFLEYVDSKYSITKNYTFSDHHTYAEHEILKIIQDMKINNVFNLITTEKDYTKLSSFNSLFEVHDIKLYRLPIEVRFLFNEENQFNYYVSDYVNKQLGKYKQTNY
jgi:tetraacyldisaccharide 4'-kinase